MQLDSELLVQGIADSDDYVQTLTEFFELAGRFVIMVAYQLLPSPGLDSGRYNHRIRHEKILRAFVTDGRAEEIIATAVVVYRVNNQKSVEMGTIADVRKDSFCSCKPFKINTIFFRIQSLPFFMSMVQDHLNLPLKEYWIMLYDQRLWGSMTMVAVPTLIELTSNMA